MRPHAVLFDMDGTLVDTESLWSDVVSAVSAELGYRLTDTDIAAVTGASVEDTAGFLAPRTAAPPELLSRRLDDAFCAAVAAGVTARPGAMRLLDSLRAAGIPLALVTASPRRVVDHVLPHLGADRFTTIVAAEDVTRTKPHPDPYLTAAARLGVRAESCVAVEDSPTGVAAAEAAGCPVLVVPSVLPIPCSPGRLVTPTLEGVDLAVLSKLAARKTVSNAIPSQGDEVR
ncbi:HAD family hydrolase [Nocardia rhizosphaerae]|uniref:HAD family hydrolase n=1 Tax=Nocardia rhizosphaerae TaxID=1691571 RepID=A0ABV8L8V1_9NOCA